MRETIEPMWQKHHKSSADVRIQKRDREIIEMEGRERR